MPPAKGTLRHSMVQLFDGCVEASGKSNHGCGQRVDWPVIADDTMFESNDVVQQACKNRTKADVLPNELTFGRKAMKHECPKLPHHMLFHPWVLGNIEMQKRNGAEARSARSYVAQRQKLSLCHLWLCGFAIFSEMKQNAQRDNAG